MTGPHRDERSGGLCRFDEGPSCMTAAVPAGSAAAHHVTGGSCA